MLWAYTFLDYVTEHVKSVSLLCHPTWKALSFSVQLSLFTQPQLSSAAERMPIRCMYTRGSVIGEAWFLYSELSPTLSLIFTGGNKCKIWPHYLPVFWNEARYLRSQTNWMSSVDGPMFSPSLVKFRPRTPENCPLKINCALIIGQQKCAKSVTQLRVVRFLLNFVDSVSMWRDILQKFKVKGQSCSIM